MPHSARWLRRWAGPRFGLDSYHPDDVNRVTNEQRLDDLIQEIPEEMGDVVLFHWLIRFHREQLANVISDSFPTLLMSETALSQAVVKIDVYTRYSTVLVEKQSMTSEEHKVLLATLANARGYIMSLKKEPFEI